MAGLLSGMFSSLGWGNDGGNKYKLAKVYEDLRQMVLGIDPNKLGLSASQFPKVWGVLMETGYKEAVVTLVSLGDGTVSLYFSNGGGYIGLGPHPGPRKASDELIAASPEFISHAALVKSFPLPSEGNTRFYFLTFDGVYSVEFKENDLGNNKSPLSPLFHKAQDVITQIRIWDEQTKAMLGAAARGEVENIRTLIKSDTTLIDSPDDTGLTPLMAAAHSGQEEAIKTLLELGASIDIKDKEGYTALMFASNAGKEACVKKLLEAGANVHEQAADGSTPIMFAAQHGFIETARLLLEHGADPSFVGKHGLSAIGFAQQNDLKDMERLFRERK